MAIARRAESALKTFISYSRKDSDFAEELVAALETCGFEAYLDQHDIAPGEPWEERLHRLILAADTVVFVVSPDSISSERCHWEITETERQGKRLLPIIFRSIGGQAVPEALRRLNYIFFDKPHSFGKGLSNLVNALNTDVEWIREHTRLLELATRWDAANRPSDRLLREGELAEAKAWLSKRSVGAQEPTPLHRAFIAESERAEIAHRSKEQQQFQAMAAAQRQREEALHAAEREQKAREEAQQNRDREIRARLRLQRFALVSITALFVLSAAAGFLALRQRDQAAGNLRFALQATDNLAVEISGELERNFDIATENKLFFSQRLDKSFRELVDYAGGSNDLRLQHAKLMTSNALMLFDVGRFALAKNYVRGVNNLLFSTDDGNATTPAPAIVKARAKLAAALDHFYDMSFSDAAEALDRAGEFLNSIPSAEAVAVKSNITLLRARLAVTSAEVLLVEQKYHSASQIEAAARAHVKEALASLTAEPAPSAARRALFTELFKLHLVRHKIADFLRWGYSEVLADLRADLASGRSDFGDDSDSELEFYQAYGLVLEAFVQRQKDRKSDALDYLSAALSKFANLVRRDPKNLVWRYHLGRVLADRAASARLSGNSTQARTDLMEARKIAVSLRRDSESPYLAFRLSVVADYEEGLTILAGTERLPKRGTDAVAEFRKIAARADLMKARGRDDTNLLKRVSYFASYGMMDGHLTAGNQSAGLQHAREALGAVEEGEYSDYLRVSVYQRLLQIDRNALGSKLWDDYFSKAVADIETLIKAYPRNSIFLSTKAYLLGLKGAEAEKTGDHAAIVQYYTHAINAELSIGRMEPDNFASISNVVLYTRSRLKVQAAMGDWNGMVEGARLVRAAIPMKETEPRAALALSAAWKAFQAELQAGVTTARSQGGVGAPLLADLQTEAQLVAKISVYLEGLLATRAKTSAFDYQALDVSKVKVGTEGDILRVNERLGWSYRPLYPAVWRTLIGQEFQESASLFSDIDAASIARIRKTSLPFYDNSNLFEAEYQDASGEVLTRAIVVIGKTPYTLNGTSLPIHEANRVAPLKLTHPDLAAAYLRFFTSYISAEHGNFQLVEAPEDLSWTEHASFEQKLAVAKVLRPVVVWADPKREGQWVASASVQYSNGVFHALLEIQPSGMMQMLGDDPVAVNQPLDPPRFRSGSRLERTTKTVDLGLLGEDITADEIKSLYELSREVRKDRPGHYAELAGEAATLQQAQDPSSPKTLNYLQHATDLNLKARRFGAAYRYQVAVLTIHESAGPSNTRAPAVLREKVALAYLSLVIGAPDKAKELAAQVLAVSPEHPRALLELAHCHIAAGEIDAAIAIYRGNAKKAIEGTPWSDVAKNELELITSNGQYGEHVKVFRERVSAEGTLVH